MNRRTGRKSIVNETLFKERSEFSEYFIGLLCTDGFIGKNDYTIQISLKDKDILDKISDITNVPIYERLDKRFDSKLYSYRFRNKQLHQFFSNIGIVNNKTKTLDLSIPLTNNILRGIFDGDGSIYKNSSGNLVVNIVSASETFTNQIKDFIEDNYITISSIKYHKNVFNINIYKQSEVNKFYHLIYTDATLFIDRKYLKFNAV